MEKLFEMFRRQGHQLFLVGGAVRDAALGRESNDLDFATDARPEETIRIFKLNGLKAIPIGIEFGTVQTILDGEKVEVTTFRCAESFTKGSRKPGVTFGDSIEEDLLRRDFTFNAMAQAEDGTFIDPFGGQSAIRRGIIVTPNEPMTAFTDDPLRMLRAARFAARGFGRLEVRTHAAMQDCAHLVHTLSGERVFEEMTKLLLSPTPRLGFEVLFETGVLEELFPSLWRLAMDEGKVGDFHHLSVWEHTMAVVEAAPEVAEVRWAALFHDTGKPACRTFDSRVHFIGHERKSAEIWESMATSRTIVIPNDFRNNVRQLIAEHMAFADGMGERGTRRMLHRLGDNFSNLVELHKADIWGHHPDHRLGPAQELNRILNLVKKVRNNKEVPFGTKFPKGTGDRVAAALGLKPGAELGKVMRELNKMLVDGDCTATSDVVSIAKTIHKE